MHRHGIRRAGTRARLPRATGLEKRSHLISVVPAADKVVEDEVVSVAEGRVVVDAAFPEQAGLPVAAAWARRRRKKLWFRFTSSGAVPLGLGEHVSSNCVADRGDIEAGGDRVAR